MAKIKKAINLLLVMILLLTPTTIKAESVESNDVSKDVDEILVIDDSGEGSLESEISIQKEFAKILFAHTTPDGQVVFSKTPMNEGCSDLPLILETLREKGFGKVTFVTNGEQWKNATNPQSFGNFSPIGLNGMQLEIVLTKGKKDSQEEFINLLEENMTNSSIKVNRSKKIKKDTYYPVKKKVEKVEKVPKVQKVPIEKKLGFLMLLIIIFLLIGILWILYKIYKLIKLNKIESTIPSDIKTMIDNSKITIIDISGSMKPFSKDLIVYTKNIRPDMQCLLFNSSIRLCLAKKIRAKKITLSGLTKGWTALETAFKQGYKEVTLVSDLMFNDIYHTSNDMFFEEINLVVPKEYDEETKQRLDKMTKKINIQEF